MTSPKPIATSPVAGAPHENRSPETPELPGQLSRDQVRRWASLIASGETEFPADLASADRELLLRESRKRLRVRLVRLIARAIALDIQSGRGQGGID